jgi:hypothetical protein
MPRPLLVIQDKSAGRGGKGNACQAGDSALLIQKHGGGASRFPTGTGLVPAPSRWPPAPRFGIESVCRSCLSAGS